MNMLRILKKMLGIIHAILSASSTMSSYEMGTLIRSLMGFRASSALGCLCCFSRLGGPSEAFELLVAMHPPGGLVNPSGDALLPCPAARAEF